MKTPAASFQSLSDLVILEPGRPVATLSQVLHSALFVTVLSRAPLGFGLRLPAPPETLRRSQISESISKCVQ
jgi:hypothetical protein